MAIKNHLAALALGSGVCVIAGPATAATTWNFLNAGCAPVAGPVAGFSARQCPGSSGSNKVTASAWAFTGNPSNTTLQAATLTPYGDLTNPPTSDSGLGLRHQEVSSDSGESSSPEHALDNDGRFELFLLSFDQAVGLNGVTTGWRQTDSDVSILAYNGAGAFGGNLTGKNYATLNADGWKLVGQYNGASSSGSSQSNQTTAINTTGSYSSRHWLVGAYNPNFVSDPLPAPSTETIGSPSTSAKDYMKLLAVADPGRRVAEPNTLALLAFGAAGLWWRRRR